MSAGSSWGVCVATMRCPRCQETTICRSLGEIEIDACARCGGVFLDRGKLNQIAEPTQGDLEYSTIHDESFSHPDRFGPITCPRCGERVMAKVEFNVHTGIILDYCDACHGFWLDGNELERTQQAIHRLNETGGPIATPAIEWFAQFLFGLPR